MNEHNKKVMVASAVIIVTGLLIGFVWAPGGGRRVEPPVSNPYPTRAPQGQVVSGFPRELILDESAKLSGSYSIDYRQNLNQYTAAFDSGKKMLSLYEDYLAYFSKNGWTVTNKIEKYSVSGGIYAEQGANTVSVAIVDGSTMRNVTVSYVEK